MSTTPICYLYLLSLVTALVLAIGSLMGWLQQDPVIATVLTVVLFLEVTIVFLLERIFEE